MSTNAYGSMCIGEVLIFYCHLAANYKLQRRPADGVVRGRYGVLPVM